MAMTCPRCGAKSQPGAFCGKCGGRLTAESPKRGAGEWFADVMGLETDDTDEAASRPSVAGSRQQGQRNVPSRPTAGGDLEVVGRKADSGDEGAMNRLMDMAADRDLNPDDYTTWGELATAVAEASMGAGQQPPSKPMPRRPMSRDPRPDARIETTIRRETNSAAIASLVLGIFWLWGVGSVLAVIFGILGRRKIKHARGTVGGGGAATAGLVLGILGIIGAIFLTALIASTGSAIKQSETATTSGCTTATVPYPDAQKTDCVAGTSGQVTVNGVVVHAAGFRRVTDEFGSKGICANVYLVNNSGKTQDYNELDFKLQSPSGDVPTFGSFVSQQNELNSGALISGGTKAGAVCFDDKGEHGVFVFIYKPDPFQATRGIWLFTLA